MRRPSPTPPPIALADSFCDWGIRKNLGQDEGGDEGDDDPALKGADTAPKGGGSLGPKGSGAKPKDGKAAAPPGPLFPKIPEWRRKLTEQRQQANAAETMLVQASRSREMLAQERLAKLKARAQRELQKAASSAALEEQLVKKQQTIQEMKAELDKRTGRDVTAKLADVPMPDEEETKALSSIVNDAIVRLYPNPNERSLIRLFKTMDFDGSHRISFNELEIMVRGPTRDQGLNISRKVLSDARMRSLWKLMDRDASGFIDHGELMRFLKIGWVEEMTPAQRSIKKLHERRQEQFEQVKEASRKRLAKDVASKATEHERASDKEVRELGDLFAKQLKNQLPYGISNPHKLFRHVDVDQSGRITFEEFSRMCRHGLKITRKAVTDDKLWGLWRAIDENENGFICAGEFGRFMRESSDAMSSQEMELVAKVAESHVLSAIGKSEDWARKKAAEADRAAAQMEAEARRLEELLSKAGAYATKPTLPPLSGSKSMPVLGRSSAPGAADAVAAEVSEESAPSPQKASAVSPQQRRQALSLLSQEVRGGGRVRLGAGRPRKERGMLKEERGPGIAAGPMPPLPPSMSSAAISLPPVAAPSMMMQLPG